MRPWTRAAPAAALVVVAACTTKPDDDAPRCSGPGSACDTGWPWDTGGWWTAGDSGRSGGDGGTEGVESCSLDGLGLCYEVLHGANIAAWCDQVAHTNGIDTVHDRGFCPGVADFMCDLTGVSEGDLAWVSDADRVVGFYTSEFPGDPEQSCRDLGGT